MRERILIIDDSAADRGLLRRIVEPFYDIDSTDDGLAAIELVKKTDYGCLLLDLRLPVFGGVALLDYWEAMSPELLPRVLIVTAFSSVATGVRERVADVIQKPLSAPRVLECVERCLAGGRGTVTES